MIKTYNYLIIFSFFLFFSGCSSSNHNLNKTNYKKENKTTPSWIYNHTKTNYICAVGSGTNKKSAFIKAKADISKQISIHIKSLSTNISTCKSKECKKSFNRYSTQQSTNMLNNLTVLNEFDDKSNSYIRVCTPILNSNFNHSTIQNKLKTTKTSCIQQSNYPNKTLDEQKKILIEQAKFNALGELYGHLLYAKTDLSNGKITNDSIKQRAIGNVRIEGNPTFYNGQNLGEICSNITAYVTQKDLEKFKPKKVELKNFCYNNPSTPTNQIKEKAKYKAYKASIEKYKPSMKNISNKHAESLIHGFKTSNEKFDFNTGVYCFDSVATLLPYELELTNNSYKKEIKKTQNIEPKNEDLKIGLVANFYNKTDNMMKKSLYTANIEKAFWLKNNNFTNRTLQNGTIYLVKIEGYLKPNNKINSLKLLADVYSAKVYIDDKLVLSDKKLISHKTLEPNKTYKLKIKLKTANAYDIALMKKEANSSYVVFNLDELYN